mmetsp:Transcript_2586/g.6633  ORF Transcript_2586/g.6633 Transcript_2586/m.6633 type:complete len:203 (-) Transcript_2586:38-646(-)
MLASSRSFSSDACCGESVSAWKAADKQDAASATVARRPGGSADKAAKKRCATSIRPARLSGTRWTRAPVAWYAKPRSVTDVWSVGRGAPEEAISGEAARSPPLSKVPSRPCKTAGAMALSWLWAACLHTHTLNSIPCCLRRTLLPEPNTASCMVVMVWGKMFAAATLLQKRDSSRERTAGLAGCTRWPSGTAVFSVTPLALP